MCGCIGQHMELNSDGFTYFKVQYRHLHKWIEENHVKPQCSWLQDE